MLTNFRRNKFKVLCDITFPLLPGQSDIPWSTMAYFQLDVYPWQPNF